jgi:hypothetical protein
MDSFLKFLAKFATAKGIVLLIVVVLLVIFVIRNLDFITEVTFKIDKSKNKPTEQIDTIKHQKDTLAKSVIIKKDSVTMLSIEKVALCPQSFRLHSYFYVEIKNTGSYPAKNVTVIIDYGKSKFDTLEFKPEFPKPEIISSVHDKNIFKIKYSELLQNQSIYLYSFLDIPMFKGITLIWDNSTRIQTYDYQQFLKDENSSQSDDYYYSLLNGKSKSEGFFDTGFGTFIEVMAALTIIVLMIFFVYVIIIKLSKLWNIE